MSAPPPTTSFTDAPPQVRDDQYQYKVISDEHLDRDFGLYQAFKNGHLVPYPSRVEGTEMWHKVRAADAALAAVTAAAPPPPPTRGRGRGRGGGGIKRKPQEQPEGTPTPKRSARVAYDSQIMPTMAPAPAKGLLASAAEVESHPEGNVADDESAPGSPEPANMANGASFTSLDRGQGKALAREKSPPLPKYAAEPDEHGVRSYIQRPSKDKGVNNRFLAPRLFAFEDWEIGFRDTSNDSSKGHTRNKRGKYLDTPNSNGMHFDHWCNGYDYSNTTRNDFDQKLVKRHGVHPTYGMFLPTSSNDLEDHTSYNIPGKPVVFIANPSGRISHASRSFQRTANHRSAVDAPDRLRIGASMKRFCKMQEIDAEEVSVDSFLPSEFELRSKSLGTAIRELESRPVFKEPVSETGEAPVAEELSADVEAAMAALSTLTYASAYVEAQQSTRPAPPTPKPARYDAIRDVFTDSKPAPAPSSEPHNVALNFLAELCKSETRLPPSGPLGEPPHPSAGAPVLHQPPGLPAYGQAPVPEAYEHQYAPHHGYDHPPPESDLRSTIHAENEPTYNTFNQGPADGIPTDPSLHYVDTTYGYPHGQPRRQLQPAGPAQYPAAEQYPGPHDPYGPPHPRNYPPSGQPAQEHTFYNQHGGYNMPDPRDAHMPSRPAESAYEHRRGSVYGAESAPYQQQFWSQQPPPGPHGPPGPPNYVQHPAHPNIQFANASGDPLPPLRPPRAHGQHVQEEPPHDPAMRHESAMHHDPTMRQPSHSNQGGYYPPGPQRPFHRGYQSQDGHPPLQPISTERMLPNPQQQGQSYMATSPQQGYASQIMSPSFGPMGGHITQSPPDTPLGGPSMFRHRSTPSGSSDQGNAKYRKLQPAPIPAHRAWSSKPELKTIPYDHKETGASAALPSSGPTQIRGWNVNQPRKRSRAEKQERADAMNERDESR